MTVTMAALLLILLVTTRMARGHWMPIHSAHVELDYLSFTLGGIPIEEIYGPDAVRHPYPLSEPCDFPMFVNAPRFELFDPEPWHHHRVAMLAQWRVGAQFAKPDPQWFTNPS